MILANHPERPVRKDKDLAQIRERLNRCLVEAEHDAGQGLTKSRKRKYAHLLDEPASSFDELCHDYSRELRRSVCRELTVKIGAREIRDKIYEYLVPSETLALINFDPTTRGNLNQGTQACDRVNSWPLYSFDFISKAELDHVWKCDEVGHAVLTELVQTWYRVNTFLITDFSLIPDFVLNDRWQLDNVPREHVSHIQLSFSQGELIVEPSEDSPGPRLQSLRANLERLKHFDPHTRITFNISSKRCSCTVTKTSTSRKSLNHHYAVWKRSLAERLEFVEDMESDIFNVLHALEKAGHPLIFIVDDSLEIKARKGSHISRETWGSYLLRDRNADQ